MVLEMCESAVSPAVNEVVGHLVYYDVTSFCIFIHFEVSIDPRSIQSYPTSCQRESSIPSVGISYF